MNTTRIFKSNGSKKEISVEDAIELYKENPGNIYSEAFFKKRHSKDNKWKLQIGEMLSKTYCLESLVDFGCGEGEYLEGALKGGAQRVLGFEYLFENIRKYLPIEALEYIKYGNVMEKIDCGKFDMVLSIEVAEHILPEKSDIFVENLTNASNKYIFMTAAVPKQGGIGHINERPLKFWIEQFKNRNFTYSIGDVSEICTKIKDMGTQVPDYIFNLFIFIKNGD